MMIGIAMAGRLKRSTLFLAMAATVCGCGASLTRKPVPSALANVVEPLGVAGLRSWGDTLTAAEVAEFVRSSRVALAAGGATQTAAGAHGPLHFLALSGGGQWGAFGAGLLRGWSETGQRPAFKGVSGVSTGAIIAPFAFLGPEYDDTLEEIYTTYATTQLIEPTVFSGLISGVALTDTRRLRGIIARYVTPDLLVKIAAEHRKGRVLMIGTTNLDAGRPVIWNIGAIADSGKPGALELVRELIRASSAIPVAFPPIFVPVEAPDGTQYDEMHVDGGASTQVTFVSPQLPIARLTREALGRNLDRRLWVVVNNNLEPPHESLPARITAIGTAAISSLIRGSGVGDVYRLYAIAQRDDIDFNVTWIPAQTGCQAPTEDFDPPFMRCLYDLGATMAREDRLWRDAPPFFTP